MGKDKPDKYTDEFVLKELQGMYNKLTEDESICFKKELFLEKDYSLQRFSEWLHAFKDNVKISETIRKINDLLETRLVKNGLNKKYSERMTKFVLINCFSDNWKDKVEHEVYADMNINIEVKGK